MGAHEHIDVTPSGQTRAPLLEGDICDRDILGSFVLKVARHDFGHVLFHQSPDDHPVGSLQRRDRLPKRQRLRRMAGEMRKGGDSGYC